MSWLTTAVTMSVIPPISLPWTAEPTGRRHGAFPPIRRCWAFHFYARPGWAGYGTILERVPDAGSRDHTAYDGMEVYYNGMDTIARKTRYARENLGGIMIWELTQDTWDREKSLLQVIGKN